MTLTNEQITQLTKGIIKHCILKQLHNFFDFPSFENFHKACECLPDANLILKTWLEQSETELDDQICKIYKDIEESIVTHLKECYNV